MYHERTKQIDLERTKHIGLSLSGLISLERLKPLKLHRIGAADNSADMMTKLVPLHTSWH